MPPYLALAIWFVLLIWFLWFDPARERGISAALWIPLAWIFIASSRLPSQWLGWSGSTDLASAYEEGNPFDRSVYLLLIFAAVGILLHRPIKWGAFLSRNLAIVSFIAYALLSCLWSDFPFVTFKKWFRDLGVYLVIAVVLSDPDPAKAIRVLLRRLCYMVIPLSIVLVKYFPEMARQYDWWTGVVYYVGVTTSKNMLGVACLVSGLYFLWDTASNWQYRKQARTKQIIRVNVAFFLMTLWLLDISDSKTSSLCLAVGCIVVLTAHNSLAKRKPVLLQAGIPSVLTIYLFLELVLEIDIRSEIAVALGRDPSLTGRAHIWEVVLGLVTNPVLGAGYETFWIGPRLLEIWRQTGNGLNHSHNGYLEVYLNLGIIGLALLGWVLASSYRTVCKRLSTASELGSLSLALWTILLLYNVTEAAFKIQLIYVIFLVTAIVVPAKDIRRRAMRESRIKLSRDKVLA
jgi:O-antigen ligase